jgi:aspartate ammonia-lyase
VLFIRAYLAVKKAAVMTNQALGYLDSEKAAHIIAAIDAIADGSLFDDFVVNPLSGGAGTSLNMNVNEVIANRALEHAGRQKGDYEYIHPLHHVNLHQSTNDTYPTALKIAMLLHLDRLENELVALQQTLQDKELQYGSIVKLGRTELQDALPITVGMQFAACAEAIARDRWRIFKARERIKTLNIGGTAIGTGFNAPQNYIFTVIENLRAITGLSITRAENLIDATQNLDAIVEVSGLLKTLAVNLLKISEDLRLLSSGPSGGFGEITLPPVQEGSTIMPGKVNPVIPEFVSQTALLVIGNDSVISHAAGLGNLELNQFYPLVATLMLQNMRLLGTAVNRLNAKAIQGISIRQDRIAGALTDSMAVATYLSQFIGHERASAAYLQHVKTGQPLREIIVREHILSESEYDSLLSPEKIRMVGLKK